VLQRRPNTFARTILSLSFFACDKAADHTYRLARDPGTTAKSGTRLRHPVPLEYGSAIQSNTPNSLPD